MPQLHFYIDQQTEARVRARAEAAGMSVSKFVANLVVREVDHDYPDGFWESVYGCWQGPAFERPLDLAFEQREPVEIHEKPSRGW